MIQLKFTNNGVTETMDVNLKGFDELVGEFMQWSFNGTLAQFKEEEIKIGSPSIVIEIERTIAGKKKQYYIDQAAELTQIDFGTEWIEITGASERKK